MRLFLIIIVLVTSCKLEPKQEIFLGLRWAEVDTQQSFIPRKNFGVAYTKGAIVVIGGFIKTDSMARKELANDVWISRDEGVSWTKIKENLTTSPTATFVKRQLFATVVIGGEIYIIGGYADVGWCLNDVWKSSDLGATWTLVTDNAGFDARYGHSGIVLNEKDIFIAGGRDRNIGTAITYYDDVWKSEDFGATWSKVFDSNFRAREGFGFINYKNEMLLVGGNDANNKLTDIWRTEENATIFYRQQNVPFEYYENSIIDMLDDIFVIEQDHVWKTIDGGIKWDKVLFDSPFLPRRGAGIVKINRKIFLLGGIYEKNDTYLNDVWVSEY